MILRYWDRDIDASLRYPYPLPLVVSIGLEPNCLSNLNTLVGLSRVLAAEYVPEVDAATRTFAAMTAAIACDISVPSLAIFVRNFAAGADRKSSFTY